LAVADDDEDVHCFPRLRRRGDNGAVGIHEDRGRAESFGEDAAQYDRARPSYPAALVDELLADGARRVLDVGSGTGIAGRLFAARGCDVLGVELDARMAEVARSHGLDVEVGSFESWEPGGRVFDLVVSGQAWHWVDPEVGADKAANVLAPGGCFAAFWNLFEHEKSMWEAFDHAYRDLDLDMSDSVALGTYRRDGGAGTIAHLEATGRFAKPEVRKYLWEQRYSRDEWLDQLPTHSDHRTLPPAQLAAVLRAVGEIIDSAGGSLVAHYDTMLVTARRLAD
jgi:SAM-dependent methyltransferase